MSNALLSTDKSVYFTYFLKIKSECTNAKIYWNFTFNRIQWLVFTFQQYHRKLLHHQQKRERKIWLSWKSVCPAWTFKVTHENGVDHKKTIVGVFIKVTLLLIRSSNFQWLFSSSFLQQNLGQYQIKSRHKSIKYRLICDEFWFGIVPILEFSINAAKMALLSPRSTDPQVTSAY